jgi:hypothetical protein
MACGVLTRDQRRAPCWFPSLELSGTTPLAVVQCNCLSELPVKLQPSV